jgi:hypothetical protein
VRIFFRQHFWKCCQHFFVNMFRSVAHDLRQHFSELYPTFFLDDTFWKFSDIFSQQHFSEVLPIFFVNIFGSVANIFSQHFLEVCQYFFPSIFFRQHFSEALPILLGVLPTFLPPEAGGRWRTHCQRAEGQPRKSWRSVPSCRGSHRRRSRVHSSRACEWLAIAYAA